MSTTDRPADTSAPATTTTPSGAEVELAHLRELNQKPMLQRYWGYIRLTGPGWLQSGLTLGGGSLASSLFLGVVAGTTMLWLQPLAMILGIVMLCAIAYVTLSTEEKPFRLLIRHVNPVLAWSWAIASLIANMTWCLPQYSLAAGVLKQNLLPGVLGGGAMPELQANLVIAGVVLVATTLVTWSYGSGHWGVVLYERLLKVVVSLIVLCFLFVVIKLALSPDEGLSWGAIFAGFVPDFQSIWRPSPAFVPMIEAIPEEHRAYWTKVVVSNQQDVMMAAFATAVGVNMTFLLPYSLLGRGWGREHRGLSVFDLSLGVVVPFVLATTCVVLAAANQFHATPVPELVTLEGNFDSGELKGQFNEYQKLLVGRLQPEDPAAVGIDELSTVSEPERELASAIVSRSAFQLSSSLAPLTGTFFANKIFGFGVLAMTLSTITILMLISGFVICEMLNLPMTGWPFRIANLAAATGALGPFVWKQASFALAIPTSVFGLMLLPIAYWSFFFLMNQKDVLGSYRPRGFGRMVLNVLLILSAGVATVTSFYAVMSKSDALWGLVGIKGLGVAGGLILFLAVPVIAVAYHFAFPRERAKGQGEA